MVPEVLYQAYQAQRDLTAPATSLAALAGRGLDRLPSYLTETVPLRWYAATNEMVARARLTHSRPSFSIAPVMIDGELVPVEEQVVDATPFGSLVHFAKDGPADQPKVLIVAALAGHFSTLLRATAQALLPDFDVYMTDWHNGQWSHLRSKVDHWRWGFWARHNTSQRCRPVRSFSKRRAGTKLLERRCARQSHGTPRLDFPTTKDHWQCPN